ncbi:MAG: AAA family ATPase, partial [bacterium]
AAGTLVPGKQERASTRLPSWYPRWAEKLAELYFSGTTSMFVVTGNTFDCTRIGEGGAGTRYGTLAEFLAGQLFGKWDLVLTYDLARGLRCLAGTNDQRLKDMVALANRRVGDLSQIPRDPAQVLAVLDQLVLKNIMAKDTDRLAIAVLIDHAAFLVPEGDAGRMSVGAATNVVTLLNWATSPYVKRLNLAFILINDKLSNLSGQLTGNPHVAAIEVPLPDEESRGLFIQFLVGDKDVASFSDFSQGELAKLTAGISLTDINVLIQSSMEAGRRLDANTFRELKKRLIERQAQGQLEFIEPTWTLDMVVGHEAAKERLREDTELLKRGETKSLPMGYLFCGPVGTGKSFIAECTAGSIGIPCVKLKNFRSKYVGETEGNLERVLTVLRAMGPVVVIIDEADTQLGDRDSEGDSGTSSRVFGMIASQMGDTRYRGKILWMLLTARPDLLPIDLKRQGRAEVHIPLFYPFDPAEIAKLFVITGKKLGAVIDPAIVPPLPEMGKVSGADIEGIVGRAWRRSLLDGATVMEQSALQQAVDTFMPSTNNLEKEMQEVAAMIECTDRQFLPPAILDKIEALGGRDKLQERLTAIRQLVESM